jgi:hypothetical protein
LLSNFIYLSSAFAGFNFIELYSKSSNEKIKNNSYGYYESLPKKILRIFSSSIIVCFFSSIFAYPFDTIKKRIQVNSSFGFESKYINNKECIKESIKDFKGLYRYLTLKLN